MWQRYLLNHHEPFCFSTVLPLLWVECHFCHIKVNVIFFSFSSSTRPLIWQILWTSQKLQCLHLSWFVIVNSNSSDPGIHYITHRGALTRVCCDHEKLCKCSILGSWLFIMHITPLSNILEHHGPQNNCYAYHTQIYCTFKPLSKIGTFLFHSPIHVRTMKTWIIFPLYFNDMLTSLTVGLRVGKQPPDNTCFYSIYGWECYISLCPAWPGHPIKTSQNHNGCQLPLTPCHSNKPAITYNHLSKYLTLNHSLLYSRTDTKLWNVHVCVFL